MLLSRHWRGGSREYQGSFSQRQNQTEFLVEQQKETEHFVALGQVEVCSVAIVAEPIPTVKFQNPSQDLQIGKE